MSIVAENWFFLLILALFVGLHLFEGRRGRSGKDAAFDETCGAGQPDGRRRRIGAVPQSPKWDGAATPIGSNAPIVPAAERRQP